MKPLSASSSAFRAVLMAVSLISYAAAQAQEDEDFGNPVKKDFILFMGRLNFDAAPDTLIGKLTKAWSYLPVRIHWGTTERFPHQRITYLKYPKWEEINGSVSMMDINKDGVIDLLLSITGYEGDSSRSRLLWIFGQDRLADQKQIDIPTITFPFQSSPFFAMDPRLGSGLSNPDDPDGGNYALIDPIEVNVRDTNWRPVTSGISWVNVYPNPAVYAANVEAQRFPAGDYHVTLIASNGAIYAAQPVTVDASGLIFRSFNLSDVPSGYYTIKITTKTKEVGAYPIVILH